MDEIRLCSRSITAQKNISQLFVAACKSQRIFNVLFQFVGFSGYLALSATSTEVNKAIQLHEEVLHSILKLKVKKLQDRQYKRRLCIHLRVDLNLYDPYKLPPYIDTQQKDDKQDDLEQIQNQAALAEAKKFGYNQITLKDWRKWKITKKIGNLLGRKPQIKASAKKVHMQVKQDITYEQKMQFIKKADKMMEQTKQLKKKLIQQYPQTQNKFQALRNQHFLEKIVNKQQIKAFYEQKNREKRSYSSPLKPTPKMMKPKQQPVQKLEQDQFFQAWSPNIKKEAARKYWKTKPSNELQWLPIANNILPKVANDISNLFQIPGLINLVKSKFRQILPVPQGHTL